LLSEIKWGIEIRQSDSDTWQSQQKMVEKKPLENPIVPIPSSLTRGTFVGFLVILAFA